MENLKQTISAVKMVISDVDGVLTDGSVYKSGDGSELKRFNVADGAGVAMARAAGLTVALISGRKSDATEIRAQELGIEDVYNGTLNKIGPYQSLKEKYSLEDQEIAFVGDDLIDIPVMDKVGVAIAVANAYPPVKDAADYITELSGGEGAFREAVTWIIKQQGRYEEVMTSLRKMIDDS